MKKRPNFRIVETPKLESYEPLFEDFEKDYLNPFITVKELNEKYDFPPRVFNDFTNRIRNSCGIKKKPTRRGLEEMTYIYELKNRWGIRKTFGTKKSIKYYGYYDDLKTAKMVRDKLYYCDFDDEVAKELIEKYSVGRYDPCKEEINEKYDDFKDLYMNSDLSYLQILEKLDISRNMYYKLLLTLRKEHPTVKKHQTSFDISDRPMRYISRNKNGYVISRNRGGKNEYFGWFKRLQDAVDRRNYLERNDWSK